MFVAIRKLQKQKITFGTHFLQGFLLHPHDGFVAPGGGGQDMPKLSLLRINYVRVYRGITPACVTVRSVLIRFGEKKKLFQKMLKKKPKKTKKKPQKIV